MGTLTSEYVRLRMLVMFGKNGPERGALTTLLIPYHEARSAIAIVSKGLRSYTSISNGHVIHNTSVYKTKKEKLVRVFVSRRPDVGNIDTTEW